MPGRSIQLLLSNQFLVICEVGDVEGRGNRESRGNSHTLGRYGRSHQRRCEEGRGFARHVSRVEGHTGISSNTRLGG